MQGRLLLRHGMTAWLLTAILVLGACASSETEPESSPPPAAGTQEPGAGEEEPGDRTAETTPDPTTIDILAGRPGDVWYVLGHSLTTFVNEDSEWLTTILQATGGLTDNSVLVLEQPDIRASVAPIISYDPITVELWQEEGVGLPGIIGNIVPFPYTIVTYDASIRELSDLAGKRIGVPRRAATTWTIFEEIFRAAGILDSIETTHGGIGPTVTAVQDGTVDAGVVLSEWYFPDLWGPGATIEEMGARGPVHFVNMDPAIVEEAFRTWNFPAMYLQAPPGTLGETQDRPITTIPVVAALVGTEQLDDDVAYELARILYERAEQNAFEPYHSAGRGVTPEWVVSSYFPEGDREAAYHPGALRYYRERGIELLEFER